MRESLWVIQLATEILRMAGLEEEKRERVADIIDVHTHRLRTTLMAAEAC